MSFKNKDMVLNSDNIDEAIGFRSVFITVSSHLSQDVQVFYNKLVEKIKSKFIEKESKAIKGIFNDLDDDTQVTENEVNEIFEEVNLQLELDEDFDFDQSNQKDKSTKTNLINYKDDQFPLFTTIREFLYLIDSTLTHPFFYRDYNNEMSYGEQQSFGTNVNRKIFINCKHANFRTEHLLFTSAKEIQVDRPKEFLNDKEDYEIGDYYDDELVEKFKEATGKKKNKNKSKIFAEERILANEVTFEVFKNEFYPTVLESKFGYTPISPSLLWSEFMCEIKGSSESHLYPAGYLPIEIYKDKTKGKKKGIKRSMINEIYQLYGKYERWKSIWWYDIMDVVNYIITQIKCVGYRGPRIHFLMVDEIQDLAFGMIHLLDLISGKSFFFAGDNAQNISKGISYKFEDLKQLMTDITEDRQRVNEHDYVETQELNLHHLNYNFRSHNKILDFANPVIGILELFFPYSIDV